MIPKPCHEHSTLDPSRHHLRIVGAVKSWNSQVESSSVEWITMRKRLSRPVRRRPMAWSFWALNLEPPLTLVLELRAQNFNLQELDAWSWQPHIQSSKYEVATISRGNATNSEELVTSHMSIRDKSKNSWKPMPTKRSLELSTFPSL